MTKNNKLPVGWAKKKLSDVIEPRGEKVSPKEYPNYKFIGMDHVEAHTTKIVGSTPASLMKSSAAKFYRGDVLYGRLRPYLNKVTRPNFEGLASAEFIVFPDNDLLKNEFLKHRLNASDFVSFASHLNEGDRPRVNFKQIGDFEILLPPLNEQKRIVAKIEELFAELDAGVASLELAQAQLKTYRQALLKHAFEGKLTAEWRQQNSDKLEDADTLLQRIQAERQARHQAELEQWQANVNTWEATSKTAAKPGKKPRKPRPLKSLPPLTPEERAELPDLPAGWAWVKVQEISNATGGYAFKSKDFQVVGSYQVIKMANVKMGKIHLDVNPVFLENVDSEIVEKYGLTQGDCLITLTGTRKKRDYGYIAMVKNQKNLLLNQRLAVIRFESGLKSEFYQYALRSTHFRDNFFKNETGNVGQGNVGMKAITQETIVLPSILEQAEIANLLESRLSVVDQIEQTIADGLQQAEALRQSILKKAFAGQLVPQDPNDEPASALLARIQAAKS